MKRTLLMLAIAGLLALAIWPAQAQDGGDEPTIQQQVAERLAETDRFSDFDSFAIHSVATFDRSLTLILSGPDPVQDFATLRIEEADGIYVDDGGTHNLRYLIEETYQSTDQRQGPSIYTLSGELRWVDETLYLRVTDLDGAGVDVPVVEVDDDWQVIGGPEFFPLLLSVINVERLFSTDEFLPRIHQDLADVMAFTEDISITPSEAEINGEMVTVEEISMTFTGQALADLMLYEGESVEPPSLLQEALAAAAVQGDNASAISFIILIDPALNQIVRTEVRSAIEIVELDLTSVDAERFSEGALLSYTETSVDASEYFDFDGGFAPVEAPEVGP
jgi:hypothetical protein